MVLGSDAEVGTSGRRNRVGTKRVVVGLGRTRVESFATGMVEGVLE